MAYFGAQHSLSLMLADWFWPLQHYSLANHVPYGYLNWSDASRHLFFGSGPLLQRAITVLAISPCFVVPALPLAAVALLVYWVVQMWRKREPRAVAAHYVLVCSALSGLLLSVVVGRADIIHFMYLMPLFALVLGWLMDGRDIPGRLFGQIRPLFIAYVLAAFLLFATPTLLRTLDARDEIQTRRGVVRVPARDTVVESVQAHVAAGEKILVYPYLPLYYYLTDTSAPTRYEYFQPGMHTPQQAEEMLSGNNGRSGAGGPVRRFILGEDSNFVAGNTAECDCPGPDRGLHPARISGVQDFEFAGRLEVSFYGPQGPGMPLKCSSGRAAEFLIFDDAKNHFAVSRYAHPSRSSSGDLANSRWHPVAGMDHLFPRRVVAWPRRLQATLCGGLHGANRARRRALRHPGAAAISGCAGRQ